MTDIKTLAFKYGGYTSLDKVYLDQLLAGRSEEEQLALITPPPSVEMCIRDRFLDVLILVLTCKALHKSNDFVILCL